jgi:hypothetical protein
MLKFVQQLEADYLVIGSGAMGMAFADTLLTDSQASVIFVDRHDRPGGHWNDAYPFVRLHAASANYGLNSMQLGDDTIEQVGLNRGFFEQASGAEICAYYDRVMQKRFLPTGRVRYFPMCDYKYDTDGYQTGVHDANEDARFVSLTSGNEYRVKVRKRIVDATFTGTTVPSRCPPKYAVAPGMWCIPPNDLPNIEREVKRYVVIGAGKTGMDVCIWLLEHGVTADRITWIMPRDSWLYDRAYVQPNPEFFAQRMGAFAVQVELIQQADSADDLIRLLGEHGQLLRIDERVTPTRFRCATVSQAELVELRRIHNVVRLGHVRRIESDRIVLDNGSFATDRDTVHIDCSASGGRVCEPVPVFDNRTITLQMIRTCQQCFSAALIAHIELSYDNDTDKNRLAKPVPSPWLAIDWLRMFGVGMENQHLWARTPHVRQWIANSRLDPNYGRKSTLTQDEQSLAQRFKNGVGPAVAKIAQLLAT